MARVMIVDDDRTTIRLLQTLLQLDGFQVSMSPRGADAVSIARQDKPDLFFIDYHLSDMDGVQLIRLIRDNPEFATTPIVVTSGLNVEREAKAAGASEFLIKPFDPDYLPRLFNRLIGTPDR